MNRLIVLALFGLIAVASAQYNPNYNNQNYNNQGQFPNFQVPDFNDLCKKDPKNCKVQTRFAEESSSNDGKGNNVKFTRVCDDKGCVERKVTNGATPSFTSMAALTICATLVGANLYFRH